MSDLLLTLLHTARVLEQSLADALREAGLSPAEYDVLSELPASFTTNRRPFLYVMCSEKEPAPPFPPLDTGKPGSSVSVPVFGSRLKP